MLARLPRLLQVLQLDVSIITTQLPCFNCATTTLLSKAHELLSHSLIQQLRAVFHSQKDVEGLMQKHMQVCEQPDT